MSTSATIKCGKTYLRRITKYHRVKRAERKQREDEEFKEKKKQEHRGQRRIKRMYSTQQISGADIPIGTAALCGE